MFHYFFLFSDLMGKKIVHLLWIGLKNNEISAGGYFQAL